MRFIVCVVRTSSDAEIFERIPGVRSVNELPEAETGWFGVPIICDSADTKTKLTKHLEDNKVQTHYFAGNVLIPLDIVTLIIIGTIRCL